MTPLSVFAWALVAAGAGYLIAEAVDEIAGDLAGGLVVAALGGVLMLVARARE